MSISRKQVENALSVQSPEALRAVLEAAGVRIGSAESSRELAEKIAGALWWSYCTPVGYAADRTDLEAIVTGVARRLKVHNASDVVGDGWVQLDALTQGLLVSLPESPGVSLKDLENPSRARMGRHWKRTAALGFSASGSFGARYGSGAVLNFLKGPIGKWLPMIPPLAPYVGSVRTGASAVHAVTGPLGLALTVLALNQSLGTNYRKLVPLLLGVGALGPTAVFDADEL